MKKYFIILIILFTFCSKNNSESSESVSFFDVHNGTIWYYGYTYEQFKTEDYMQFLENNGSQGSTFLNVCEIHDGKSFSRKLDWGDNFNFYENGCANNFIELVKASENELIYKSTYYTGNIINGLCSEIELQDLPTNPQLISWSVKDNLMTVRHENEESITQVLTIVDSFDKHCFN